MLSTDKLANYSNILASVEKLTHKETKADTIEALNNLSDKQLQTVNSRSDILDKILRGIECFNQKNNKSTGNFYYKDPINRIINLFSQGGYDRLINTNSNILELLISYGGNLNNFLHLNDDKFHCLIANEDFCKVLLKAGHMDDFLEISYRDTRISNENFKRYINNQDLILVCCFTSNDIGTHFTCSLRALMVNPNRNSMIDKLYSLEQQGKLYCDKKSLDLILLNLPIIKQLVCNDASGNVIETLKSYNYAKIALLLKSAQENIQQKTGMKVSFVKCPNPEEKYYSPRVDSDTLKISCITTLIKNEHELSDEKVQSFHKAVRNKSIEAQEEGKLNNPQITQAISNVQSLT
ncbi:hypothetical protein [Candidatus Mesenet endosymbiont of Agriotes lineatus]|uniref:hypothetical protein n=1 Tax=Candidatus Mesenet endosymbiont of Agriotes lineatus TaxID=3077948 RepID=UPI0030D1DD94